MIEKEKINWETIDGTCERLKVPGGWLVEATSFNAKELTFIPDINHIWGLNDYDFK